MSTMSFLEHLKQNLINADRQSIEIIEAMHLETERPVSKQNIT